MNRTALKVSLLNVVLGPLQCSWSIQGHWQMWMCLNCHTHFLEGPKSLSDHQPEFHVTTPESSVFVWDAAWSKCLVHAHVSWGYPAPQCPWETSENFSEMKGWSFLAPGSFFCRILTSLLLVTELFIHFCPDVDSIMEHTPFPWLLPKRSHVRRPIL